MASKRPKVTFALFTYNQKLFIKEAIDAALAQDYEPLEIIISDDASTDGTWEIIEKSAERYSGPHTLCIRRNNSNVGTLQSVLHVAKIATGEFLVVAAGDDLSYPSRTRKLVEKWCETGAAAVTSRFDVIGERGEMICSNVSGLGGAQPRRWFSVPLDQPLIKGAAAGYDKGLVCSLPDSGDRVLHEDIVLNSWLIANGLSAARCEEVMVGYRRNSGSISNMERAKSWRDFVDQEIKRAQDAHCYISTYDYLIQLFDEMSDRSENVSEACEKIKLSRRIAQVRSEFLEKSFSYRISAIKELYRTPERRHLIARLFGIYPYATAKAVVRFFESLFSKRSHSGA